jgi:nuclear transport factor 2 (NTF2) superfamily protein
MAQAENIEGEATIWRNRSERTPDRSAAQNCLSQGSDHKFRRLVNGLIAFLARHQAVCEDHAAVIGLAGIEYTVA